MTEIITAIISGVVTLLVCIITNSINHKKTITLIEYKIDELTKRVDRHNNLIERTYELEKEVAILKERGE